jgi:nicotinamide-nucleotide amidase
MTESQAIASLRAALEKKGQTLSCAESCTGGLLSAALTASPGASKIFLGSVVSYHRDVKVQILGVAASLIDTLGEVSLPVALEMARGARSRLNSDWAVAITGIAGPSGGSVEKPVGHVCFAVVGPHFEGTELVNFGAHLERSLIQRQSVLQALNMLRQAVDQNK